MKPKSATFFTEINKTHSRSQTTTEKELGTASSFQKTKLSTNDLPKSKQSGHVNSTQIKTSKMKVLDYMVNEGTQFANLENIEEFYKESASENNKKYDSLSDEIARKKEQLDNLDNLIKNVRAFIFIVMYYLYY